MKHVPLNHPLNHYVGNPVEPGFHGKNFKATLFHPKLPKQRLGFIAYSEREARRQAWRHALSQNLPGFVIRVERLSLMP